MNEATLQVSLAVLQAIRSCKTGTHTSIQRLTRSILKEQGLSEEDIDTHDLAEIIEECVSEADDYWLDTISQSSYEEYVDPYTAKFTLRKLVNPLEVTEIQPNKLESFHFSIGGFFSGSLSINIYKENDIWLGDIDVISHHNPDSDTKRKRSLSTKMMNDFESCLTSINILSWDHHYWESYLDGFQWSLSMGLTDGTGCTCNGSNARPEGFDQLLATLEHLGLTGATEYAY